MRIKVLRIAIVLLFIVLLMELVYTQIVRGPYYYSLSLNNRVRVLPLEGVRGRIIDRQGVILADNRLSYNLTITPQDIKEKSELFKFLSQTFKEDVSVLEKKYAKGRLAPFSPVVIVEDLKKEQLIVLEENKFRFPAIDIQKNYKRIYPLGKNSAHILGYVGKANQARMDQLKEYGYTSLPLVGYTGLEQYYDNYLRGESGGEQVEVNSRGQQVRLLSYRDPSRGEDITTTIDADIQQKALELLGESRGAIIVMDMDNGEILSLSSSPSFDPNSFVDLESRRQLGTLFSDPASPLLNRAVTGTFPPGSVFKIPVAMCALSQGKINAHTTFHCDGAYQLGDKTFRCTHVHGPQDLIEAIAHSCNIYFYNVGRKLGVEAMSLYASGLGLGQLTHIDLPYEKVGQIPSLANQKWASKRQWYAGEILNFSIGQGEILTTPLQLLSMMTVIANKGKMVMPHLIKAIGNKAIEQYSFSKQIDIDPAIFEMVHQGLRDVVHSPSGTAHILDFKDLYVAGKTGTAQSFGTMESHAWFVGFAKGKKNISFCVFLEHGGSSYNACVLARELLVLLRQNEIL